MRIQHNIMAMSAYRNYTNNVSAMKKNLEKLSSGYKINRAGDDAAGLAISEKMRAQITGLETAQKNAKDGISLVQTAEGALTEVHDMLNRMVELASMSANGTYDNTTDRAQLQKEMDQLRDEINRIADSANFNGINLLDGSMQEGAVVGMETNEVDIVKDLLPKQATDATNNELGVIAGSTVVETAPVSASGAKFDISLKGLQTITASGTGDTFSLKVGNDTLTVTLDNGANTAGQIAAKFQAKYGTTAATVANGNFTIKADGDTLKFESTGKVDLVPGAKVTWEWTPSGKAAEHTDDIIMPLDNVGILVQANAGVDSVETGVDVSDVGVDASFNTKTDVVLKDALATAFGATTAADGNITLQYDDGASAWKLSAGGVELENVSATFADGKLTVSVGSDAVLEVTVNAGSTTTSPTEDDVKAAFNTARTVGVYTAPVDDTTTTPTATPPATTTTTGSGSVKLTVAATTDFDAAQETDEIGSTDVAAVNTALQNGTIQINGKNYELKGVTAEATDTIKSLGQKIAKSLQDQMNAADDKNTYAVEVKIGNNGPFAAQVAGDMTITANYTATPKAGGGDTEAGAKFHGVINSGMQNTNSGADEAKEILANTRIDLDKVGGWADGTEITIGNKTFTIVDGANSNYKDAANALDITGLDANARAEKLANAANEGNDNFVVGHDKGEITLQQKNAADDMETVEGIASYLGVKTTTTVEGKEAKVGSKLRLQIGDTADKWNQLEVDIRDTHCTSLGKIDEKGNLVGKSLADISIANQKDAAEAIDVIKDAINTVSDIRGTLGATQNRLDHTINNLSVMTENIQDAESTIRDVDVAEEMMAYTKNNILIQSAQAMLAQANQVPQGVLQLLQ